MTRPLLVLCVVLGAGASAYAACLDTSGFDDAQRAVDAAVGCDTVASNREYVAAGLDAIAGIPLTRACRSRLVKERLKRSVCGRPGSVVCCARSSRGRVTNRVVRTGHCKNGELCEGARSVGAACTDDGHCLRSACPARGPGIPSQVTFTTRGTRSDLDFGWTGAFHNLPFIAGARLTYCLEGCDGTADTSCTGRGSTGDGTLNGPTFGAPLPVVSAGVPLCVASRFSDQELLAAFDVATGASEAALRLSTDIYLTNNLAEACPRCVVDGGDGGIGSLGTCSAGSANPGATCRVEGTAVLAQGSGDPFYTLSSSCVPPAAQRVAAVDISAPLTTGTSTVQGPLPCADPSGPQMQDDACGAGTCTAACRGPACAAGSPDGCVDAKGGLSQVCCSTNSATPCFPTRGGGAIARIGTPFDASPMGAFVATFCVPRTGSSLINGVSGLPGPGALIVPVDAVVERAP